MSCSSQSAPEMLPPNDRAVWWCCWRVVLIWTVRAERDRSGAQVEGVAAGEREVAVPGLCVVGGVDQVGHVAVERAAVDRDVCR